RALQARRRRESGSTGSALLLHAVTTQDPTLIRASAAAANVATAVFVVKPIKLQVTISVGHGVSIERQDQTLPRSAIHSIVSPTHASLSRFTKARMIRSAW